MLLSWDLWQDKSGYNSKYGRAQLVNLLTLVGPLFYFCETRLRADYTVLRHLWLHVLGRKCYHKTVFTPKLSVFLQK